MSRMLFLLLGATIAQAQTYASTTTFTFAGTTLPTGLTKATWSVKNRAYDNTSASALASYPYAGHNFTAANVYVSGGYLNLLVPGGQQNSLWTSSAEVATTFRIASARVGTWALLTDVPGVCNGMFYYAADTQETDIEWLGDVNAQSNINAKKGRALFYTNQPAYVGANKTQWTGWASPNVTDYIHNYRIDWSANSTMFYLDRRLQHSLYGNVPNATSGVWVWNNWSNGKNTFTAGPPATDAVFKIQKIVMYYNPGSK